MEGYLDDDDDVLTLRVPAAEHVEAGLRAIFGLTPSTLAALWFVYWLVAPATGLALALFAGLSAALVFGVGGLGLLRVVRAGARSDRSEVRIDLGERLFYGRGQEPAIFRQPSAVEVRFVALGARLVLRRADGDIVLLRRTSLLRHATLVGDARRLARRLDVPLEAPSVASAFVGLELPRVRRMAVYFPLTFVALPALLTALATSDDDEQRFAAKQSAALFTAEGLTLGLIAAFFGLPALALSSRAPIAAALVVLLPLAAFWLVRTALRLYASHRTLSGERFELWLIAGLLGRPGERDGGVSTDGLSTQEQSGHAPSSAHVSSAHVSSKYASSAHASSARPEPAARSPRPNYATATAGSFDGPLPGPTSAASGELARRSREAVDKPTAGEEDPRRTGVGGGWWR